MNWFIMFVGFSLMAVLLGQAAQNPNRFAPADLVAPYPGAPLSAEQVEERTQKLPDGTSSVEVTTNNIYRDTKGRLRIESRFEGPAGQPAEVLLLDPITGSRVMLIAATKKGLHIAGPKYGQPGFALGFGGVGEALPAGNWDVTTEDIGKRVIAGLSVEGSRITHTYEGEPSAARVEERWYSKDLNLIVLAVASGPKGTHTARLEKMAFGDPDARLFSIPPEYDIQEVEAGLSWPQ